MSRIAHIGTGSSPPAPNVSTMRAAIQTTGVVKKFGDVTSVDGLNLTIPAGSFYGIAGPNGAGKTTSIRMITGLLQPDAGSIEVAGIPVWPNPRRAKAVLGYVADNPPLFGRLTAREMLDYAGMLRGMAAESAAAETICYESWTSRPTPGGRSRTSPSE